LLSSLLVSVSSNFTKGLRECGLAALQEYVAVSQLCGVLVESDWGKPTFIETRAASLAAG
jgi:hypothetical protein